MFVRLDDETKILLEEISALSGIQKDVVREVWEFTLIRWVEQITRDPQKLNELPIPFLGKVAVRYERDVLKPEGTLDTEVSSFVKLNPMFKKLIGDIVDEGTTIIDEVLEKKISNALATTLDITD